MAVKIITLLAFMLLLNGCSLVPHILYKIDVQQGNVVTEEMVDKLKPDMTKAQVRFVLGTPLIVDPFRINRWDYVFIQRRKGDLAEQKRLTIFFNENHRLTHTEIQQIYPDRKKETNTDTQLESQNAGKVQLNESSENQGTTDTGTETNEQLP